MADRQGLSSLHSLCAREQVSSSGNLVFDRALSSLHSLCAREQVSSSGNLVFDRALSSLHSLCAREQVSSSGNLVFDRALARSTHSVLESKFPPPETWFLIVRWLAPLTLCWGVSFLLQKLGVINCRDTRHYVEHSNFVLSPVYKRHYPNPLEEGWGNGGPTGIRTLDTLLEYTPLAGERFRPLSHRS